MSKLLLGVNRDVEMLGKANKSDPNFNEDTATRDQKKKCMGKVSNFDIFFLSKNVIQKSSS